MDCYIGADIQTLSKRFFLDGVINDMVIQVRISLDSVNAQLVLDGRSNEYIGSILFTQNIVGDILMLKKGDMIKLIP